MITKYQDFLNESENNELKLSEIINDQIVVYEETIRKLLTIGEGIDDISIRSQFVYNEYQNEIVIIFIENAWGGIDYEEWNIVKRLDKYKGVEGFDDYAVNASHNKLVLIFTSNEYPIILE